MKVCLITFFTRTSHNTGTCLYRDMEAASRHLEGVGFEKVYTQADGKELWRLVIDEKEELALIGDEKVY